MLHPVTGEPVAEFTRSRAECLERYREKKARRLYTKKIRYHLRKINADKRPRIKGRFVKKEELEQYLKQQDSGTLPDDILDMASSVFEVFLDSDMLEEPSEESFL